MGSTPANSEAKDLCSVSNNVFSLKINISCGHLGCFLDCIVYMRQGAGGYTRLNETPKLTGPSSQSTPRNAKAPIIDSKSLIGTGGLEPFESLLYLSLTKLIINHPDYVA